MRYDDERGGAPRTRPVGARRMMASDAAGTVTARRGTAAAAAAAAAGTSPVRSAGRVFPADLASRSARSYTGSARGAVSAACAGREPGAVTSAPPRLRCLPSSR